MPQRGQIDPATLQTASAPIALPSGANSNITVGITPDGVMVVMVPEEVDSVYDENTLLLIALAIARLQLGVDHTAITSIVMQRV